MRTASMGELIGWLNGFINPGKGIVGVVLGGTTAAVAWWQGLPHATICLAKGLALLMAIDLVLGGIAAIKRKEFSLTGFSNGLYKLVTYAVVILFGSAINWVAEGSGIKLPSPFFVNWTLAFLAIRDALSVAEHMAELEMPMPAGWRKWLRRLRRQLDDEGKATTEETG